MDDAEYIGLASMALNGLRVNNVSRETVSAWENRLSAAYSLKDLPQVKLICEELLKTYPYLHREHIEQITTYAENMLSGSVGSGASELPPVRTDALVLALSKLIPLGDTFQIRNIAGNFSYKDACNVIRAVAVVDPDNVSKSKLPFLISNEFKIKGVVLSNLYGGARQVQLYTIHRNKEGLRTFKFFDEEANKGRPGVNEGNLSWPFYVYNFYGEDGKEYALFTTRELSLGRCSVDGMRVSISDKSPFGDTVRLSSVKNTLFAHTVNSDLKPISKEEAEVIREKYDYELLMSKVRGGYKHPEWFERTLAAWLFSGKCNGFPLHVGWLSEAGVGKSTIIHGLNKQMGELQDPAAVGTFLGLVPNFGGAVPNEGYLCRCQRIAVVDEFFAMLSRSAGRQDGDSGTSLLMAILEHQTYSATSGKHANFKVQMMAKVLFASNVMKSYVKYADMPTIARNTSNPFLSRVLWYVQTPSHTEFIDRNKGAITEAEQVAGGTLRPAHDAEFVNLYDWFNSFTVVVPFGEVDRIFEKYRTTAIPEDLQELYRARYKHHIVLLVDGIAKLNWILQRREKLEARPEDVDEADRILATCVLSWTPSNVLHSDWVDPRVKENYLPHVSKQVLYYVREHPGVTAGDIAVPNAETILTSLANMHLINMVQDKETLKWRYGEE